MNEWFLFLQQRACGRCSHLTPYAKAFCPPRTATTWKPAALNCVSNSAIHPVKFNPTDRLAVLWRGSADVMLAVAKTMELMPRLTGGCCMSSHNFHLNPAAAAVAAPAAVSL